MLSISIYPTQILGELTLIKLVKTINTHIYPSNSNKTNINFLFALIEKIKSDYIYDFASQIYVGA